MSEMVFSEATFTRVSLLPGEVLGVKVVSDTLGNSTLSDLQKKLSSLFPNNKVMVFCMPVGEDISFTAMSGSPETCGPQACIDCNCGKKEALGDTHSRKEANNGENE